LLVSAVLLTMIAVLPIGSQSRAYAASTVTNGNFDATGATKTPPGWSTTGTSSASYTEWGGRTGYRLTHWSSSAYTVSTWQTLTGLANGNYTLSVWVETTGGLTYDPATDTYTYVWRTDKSWANTCRQLTVRLSDGTTHTALYSFR
jgi:arabinogalactan endo-1,4-beta-galactosidase